MTMPTRPGSTAAPPGHGPAQLHLDMDLPDPQQEVELFPYSVRLSGDTRRILEQYLTRTTAFWNYMLRHIKPIADEYLDSPGTSLDYSVFHTKAIMVYREMQECSDISVIGTNWIDYVRKIRALPEDVLVQRLNDLLVAYRSVKEGKVSTGLPQWKSDRSSHSVRFGPDNFTIEPGIIHVKSVYPFSLQIPGVEAADPGYEYTLSITRRRLPANAGTGNQTYGPADDEDRSYAITLSRVKL